MNERIVEIINFLEEFFDKEMVTISGDIMEELLFEGYLEHEIEEAISWIETYQSEKEQLKTFDVKEEYNNISINKEAYNYLTSLLGKKIITETIFDDILNHCLFLADEDVDLQKIIQYHESVSDTNKKLGNEVRANYRAVSLKKDC